MQITIAKTHTLEVKTETFSQAVNDYLYEYGLRQVLNDAGSTGKNADEKLAMAQKKLDALYAGELRQARESDPVRAEARNMAKQAVLRDLKKVGKKVEDLADGQFASIVNDRLPRFMAAAKVVVDARREAEPESDASDILAALGE